MKGEQVATVATPEESTVERLFERIFSLEDDLRGSLRRERKLRERLNRIANLTPGRQRIYRLDHAAMLFECDADFEQEEGHDTVGHVDYGETLRAESLMLRRLAWDLGELRDAVRGDRRMPGSRNDPTLWKGERP